MRKKKEDNYRYRYHK